MKVSQAGEFARNRSQVYNTNRKLKKRNTTVASNNDALLDVITKAKEEQKGRIKTT